MRIGFELMCFGTRSLARSINYDYGAWGEVHPITVGTADNPYLYVGQLGYYTHYQDQDPEFGLLQLGVRFYEPAVGRFEQRDRVENVPNRYPYASGVPTMRVDPSGQMDEALRRYYLCVGGCVAKAIVPGADIGLDIIKIRWPQGRPPAKWWENPDYLRKIEIKVCLPWKDWGSRGPGIWRALKSCLKKLTLVLTVVDLLRCLDDCIADNPGARYCPR